VVLFAIACWAVLLKKDWALYLLVAISAFDIVGEFIVQGTLSIAVNVSILVAVILLILCVFQLRKLRKTEEQ
jgi:hypothetical protein